MSLDSLDIKALVSKVLGYAILVGAFGLKVPQIMNIVRSKSTAGLSEIGFYVEVPLVTTTVIYNFLNNNPISSYGETVVILLQNIILVFIMWTYGKPRPSLLKVTAILGLFIAVGVISFKAPKEYLYLLPLSNLPLLLISKFSQIIQNYQQKSTGQLSLITTFLSFAGSMARIFTTLQEVGNDFSLLAICILGSLTSGILLLQILADDISKFTKSKKKE